MAGYNNYVPSWYQYPYQSQQQMPPLQQSQPQQNQGNGIIWVQGEAGAKSYLVAPNTTVQLWDSEAQRIYLKSADASGMPSIKTLEYVIKDTPNNMPPIGNQNYSNVDMSQYVTKKELEEILAKNRTGDMRYAEPIVSATPTV